MSQVVRCNSSLALSVNYGNSDRDNWKRLFIVYREALELVDV